MTLELIISQPQTQITGNPECDNIQNVAWIQANIQFLNTIKGVGISNIEKTSTVGLVDTYTITYTDGTTDTFDVTNGTVGGDGRGIVSILKTSTQELTDTYTITYTDDTTSTFEVTNGVDGVSVESITLYQTVGLVDTYEIVYSSGSRSYFNVTNGEDGIGADGRGIVSFELIDTQEKTKTYRMLFTDATYVDIPIIDGNDGVDGLTPYIGINGNWWIGDVDQNIKAEGVDGISPTIGLNGNWYFGAVDTGVKAQGADGHTPIKGVDYFDGITPTIGLNKHWFIGAIDTGIVAEGKDGEDGVTPIITIGENENWYINGVDSGKPSRGANGPSAYEIYHAGGGTLSEVDFNASITNIPSHIADTTIHHTIDDLDVLYEPKNSNIQEHITATDNPHETTKAQVGLGNAKNPTAYGGISYGGASEPGISFTDLNSLTFTGFYTCYGTCANVPSSSYSWFIEHVNSNVGNVSATQTAIAYSTTRIVYMRRKIASVWGTWELLDFLKLDQTTPQTTVGTFTFPIIKANSADITGSLTADNLWYLNGNTLGAKKTLGSTDNQDFGIITNNTERLTVSKDGDVGIGNTLAVSKSIKTEQQFISTVANGTAPLSVNSNTLVPNLNAELLEGLHSTDFQTVKVKNILKTDLNPTSGTFWYCLGRLNAITNGTKTDLTIESMNGADSPRIIDASIFTAYTSGRINVVQNMALSHSNDMAYWGTYKILVTNNNKIWLYYVGSSQNFNLKVTVKSSNFTFASTNEVVYSEPTTVVSTLTLADQLIVAPNFNITAKNGIFDALVSPKWYPRADSVSALQINKADGVTNIFNVDTTNSRIGIGTNLPKSKLQVVGGIQCGDDTDAASADKLGTRRRRTGVNGNIGFYVSEECAQTDVNTYAWVEIFRNEWIIP